MVADNKKSYLHLLNGPKIKRLTTAMIKNAVFGIGFCVAGN